jgi:uncharacterized protein YecT (DUF1311 family)
MLLALLAVLSLQDAGPGAARAAAEAALANAPAQSEEAVDCDHAMTTYDMNVCTGQALDRETSRMDRYLVAARTRAEAIDADSGRYGDERSNLATFLRTSQTAWEAYSTIACDGVQDQWKGGTIRTIQSLGCKIELTRERTHFIWANYLTYMDSTPPVLPEPIGEATDTPASRD